MKTKKTLFALVASLVLASLAAIGVGCSNPPDSSSGDPIPKSYSFEGVLFGEKEFPAFLELQEGGSVKLEYIMSMGTTSTAHTVITNEGSWTQNDQGVITSVTLKSNGDDYSASVTSDTIVIGYSLDFSTFTVSVADVKADSQANIYFKTSLPKSHSFEGVLYGEKEFPAFLELKEDGSVSLEYIMTMGQADNTAHTVIAAEGSWTQDVLGRVNSVKFMSNGDEYEAVVDKKAGTITIGYSLDFATFTVSVSDVKTGDGAKNIVISTVAKAE